MRIQVELNGTRTNPWNRLGLVQNPFPKVAKRELTSALLALQSLGGEPIPNEDYIREKLSPHFTDEFVELCCRKFKKGQVVKFEVVWEG